MQTPSASSLLSLGANGAGGGGRGEDGGGGSGGGKVRGHSGLLLIRAHQDHTLVV